MVSRGSVFDGSLSFERGTGSALRTKELHIDFRVAANSAWRKAAWCRRVLVGFGLTPANVVRRPKTPQTQTSG
jgi:hypothetical protein